jgi:hypothetical protein
MRNMTFARLIILSGTIWSTAYAQEVTASLSGTVKDSSGAVIVGAAVTAVQLDTNQQRTARTAGNGDFVIPLLRPGRYSVTVAQPGFKTYNQSDLALEVNQHANLDIVLEIGTPSERVQVSAQVPVIQTEDAAIGKVVDSTTIVNTPMNSRLNIIGLLSLAPGLQINALQDAIPNTGVTMTLNGAASYGSLAFSLDGATNTTPFLERGFAEFPPLDGISEFKAITSGANAEFGKPNQVIIVTKSGTNQFHATALEFNRNRFLAAKNFFASALPLPQYNRNEFGGNFSGPVSIPRLYKGADHTFFFVNYEGFRRSEAPTASSQMPTQAERSGDFTAVGTILDPFSGAPFPGAVIPAARLNGIAQKLQQLYPLPNRPGIGTNLVETIPLHEHVDRTSIRLDHMISGKDQISGSFLQGLLGPNPAVGLTSAFGGMAGIGEHNYNTSIGWNHIFSPSLVSETRVSYLHVRIFRTPQNQNLDLSFIPGLGPQDIPGAPTITIRNITNMSEQGSRDLDQTFQWNENVTKSHQAHTFKAGLTYLHSDHWNASAQSPARGSYTFNGQYTGVGYADFILGYPSGTGLPVPSVSASRYRQNRIGVYIQDDWKVNAKLTVNYGIRYDVQIQQANARGDNSLFVPAISKVVVFAPQYPKSAIPQLLSSFPTTLASQAGLSNNPWDYLGQDTNNIAPRLGLSYKLGSKTVMRAAFGMFYNMLPTGDTGGPLGGQLPFGTSIAFTQPAGKTPAFTLNNPFPGNGTIPANPSVSAESAPVTPYTMQWNYTLQHELPSRIALRVSNVGQHNLKQNANHVTGQGLTATPDLNAVAPAAGNPQTRRPIQPFAAIGFAQAPLFQSRMNSLQVGLQKRYENGLLLNMEYQWTRVLGTEGFINPFNWNDSKGNLNNIRGQVMVLSHSYEFPFGKGKRLLGNARGILDKMVSGWTVSGITTAESGFPFSPGFTTSVQGSVGGRPDRVRGANLYPANQTIAQWFNPAAFQAPPEFTYGNASYNPLWGPGIQNWDISLAKRTALTERANLQLRLDAFDTFNHPLFSNPAGNISNPATVGQITTSFGSRTVQIGAKLQF